MGWPLWSRKDGVNQPPGSNVGEITEKGAYAIYYRDNQPTVTLLLPLQNARMRKSTSISRNTPLNTACAGPEAVGTSTAGRIAARDAEQLDVSGLPRLDGAMDTCALRRPTQLSYSVPGPVADVVAATKRLLAADGWQPYASPSENSRPLGLDLKKGSQGLSVSFYMPPGEPVHSGVDYRLSRLDIDLPFPDDATDIVFDERRPYLNCVTAGTIDAALALFDKQLAAMGWSRLSATAAPARWPNANLDEKVSSGALVDSTSRREIRSRSRCRCNAQPTARPRSKSRSRRLRNPKSSRPGRTCPVCQRHITTSAPAAPAATPSAS